MSNVSKEKKRKEKNLNEKKEKKQITGELSNEK